MLIPLLRPTGAYRLLISVLALALAGCANDHPFTPIDPAEGNITAAVGDPAAHSVFVQLATGRVTRVPVESWDLAFESAHGRHVLINTGTKARVLDTGSTDFAAVTSTNAADYPGSYAFETIDGDLAKAAMGPNPVGRVFVLDLGADAAGAPLGYKKLQIEQYTPGSSVRLRYANPDGTDEQSRTIALSGAHDFTYFSLRAGHTATVEPERGAWDLVLTPVTVRTGPPHAPVYRTAVAALSSRYGGVRVAVDDPGEGLPQNDDPASARNQMGIEASRYATLSRADFMRLGPRDAADTIGRSWLQILQPHSAGVYKVYSFITYLVKDPHGRHFKLRFLSYVDPATGRNGTVQFEYRALE